MDVWVSDLGVFCLLHFALVTNSTWDMNRSADEDPLHNSWMYSDIRNSPASGKKETRGLADLHCNVLQMTNLPEGTYLLMFSSKFS